jgi:hypothetical protein
MVSLKSRVTQPKMISDSFLGAKTVLALAENPLPSMHLHLMISPFAPGSVQLVGICASRKSAGVRS